MKKLTKKSTKEITVLVNTPLAHLVTILVSAQRCACVVFVIDDEIVPSLECISGPKNKLLAFFHA